MKLKVQSMQSIRDLDGNLGKRIDMVEEREATSQLAFKRQTDEERIAQNIFQTMQVVVPQLCPQRMTISMPKIILFLTEQECDSLGVDFNVNQVYEVTLDVQGIKFKKAEQP